MPTSALRPLQPVLWSILLCIWALLLGGCDGSGSKRASLYQRLVNEGPWTVERLDGDIDYTRQLNEQHPQGVTITFQGGDGGRSYRIATSRSGDSTEVLAEGSVSLRGDNVLRMDSGFAPLGPVRWTFGFEASRAVFALQFGSRAFLRALFSEGSQNENLEMTLAPADV